jgi:hypothetical protein
MIGLSLELVCDRYQARGSDMTNSITVVTKANLKDSKNGAKSSDKIVSII